MITDIVVCVIGALMVLVVCGLAFEKGRLAGIRQSRRTDPEKIAKNVNKNWATGPATATGMISGFILDSRTAAQVICKKCEHPLRECTCPERKGTRCKHSWPCDLSEPIPDDDPKGVMPTATTGPQHGETATGAASVEASAGVASETQEVCMGSQKHQHTAECFKPKHAELGQEERPKCQIVDCNKPIASQARFCLEHTPGIQPPLDDDAARGQEGKR